MQIHFTLNHKKTAAEIAPDTLLIDLVRMAAALPRWRACRRKPLSSARSSLTRGPSSAASATPALS